MMQTEYCHRCGTPLTEWETGPLCEGCGRNDGTETTKPETRNMARLPNYFLNLFRIGYRSLDKP